VTLAPPLALGLQAPLFLLLLLALPVLVMLYVRHERTAVRGAAAFASPKLLPAVAPVRPRWRRHVPVALYLLALTVLVVALARPQVTVAVPIDQARVLLVFDQSGSMASEDVAPNRLAAARTAARSFLRSVPKRVQVGAIAYNQGARVIQGPTTDRQAVSDALAAVTPRGSTATGDALTLALSVARRASQRAAKPPPSAIVLLSDGKSVRGRDPVAVARAAAKQKVPIYTVSLGTQAGTIQRHDKTGKLVGTTPVPPDPQTLARIAQVSGGRSYDVHDAARLSAVYKNLGTQLAMKDEPRQITAGVAGGALALVLAGGLASLFWFGRLP
jgi:Ca-activated chloride channel family protein